MPKKAATKRGPVSPFMRPVALSPELQAVLGKKSRPRSQIVKDLWIYIRKHDLQDAVNRQMINADDKLRVIFGKSQVTMFEMTKLVNKHLSKIL